MRRLVLACAAAAVWPASGVAQSPAPTELPDVRAATTMDHERSHVPAIQVALVDSGRLVYADAFGMADLRTGAPATTDMLFRVGSATKVITCLTVLSLAEEHHIGVDDAIGRYVPGLAPRLAQLTLAQLMSHTAGVRDLIVASPIDADTNESDLLREVRSWGDTLLFTTPSSVMSYSNLGYVLLGAFIEQVSGQHYADAVAARVLRPLGMTDAGFRLRDALARPHATGHVGPFGRPTNAVESTTDTRHWPAGFLWATASDYARVAIALMNGGIIDGRRVLSASSVRAIVTPRAPIMGDSTALYGFGMMIVPNAGDTLWEHGGDMEGFAADFAMEPSRKRAFVALHNRNGGARATSGMLRRWLGARAGARPSQDSATAVRLEGTYVNGRDSVVITRDTAGLAMRYKSFPGRATPATRSTFVYRGHNEYGQPTTQTFFIIPGGDGRARYVAYAMRAYARVSN